MTTTASSTIVRNLQHVRAKVAQAAAASAWKQSQCTLVAVSKTKPVEDLRAAYEHEQRHFGENYIQELIEKAPQLPADVQWHFIGHVQSNKAKALVRDVPNLFMVETVDSVKVANALNKAAGEFRAAQLNVLLQVNTSGEEQKSGATSLAASVELAQHIARSCEHLRLAGLMTIGRYDDTTAACFERLVATRTAVADALGTPETELELSMGMSGDFELAIACGSTFVRVGSTIFGDRNYSSA
ncbi:hypothetical protein PybrP1_008934 [[Pythium] brassicae (nom. inval.)]|nr:hypothetical protein PybrP1_008934 [[Pythium] brassicae (nom. inval.)]